MKANIKIDNKEQIAFFPNMITIIPYFELFHQ